MRPPATLATLFLSVCQWMLVSPLNVDIKATSPNTNTPVDATEDGCIIRTFESEDCSGSNWEAWSFVPSGCRSCEGVGGDAHSFNLVGNCPYGFMAAYEGNDCVGPRGLVPFYGVGCYAVNTGMAWITLKPCFYDLPPF